jgi:hypothetical protein
VKVRSGLAHVLPVLLALAPSSGFGQEWNALTEASGWTAVDRDGSCTFYEARSRRLITWSWEAGTLGELDAARARQLPEKWVLDAAGNAWTVQGASLQQLTRGGKPGTSLALPAEVGDLAWDATTFVLAYRTRELYLEKRDLKTGSLLWSYGTRPAESEGRAPALHHVAIKEDGQVIFSTGASLTVTSLDGAKGKLLGSTSFELDGGPAPQLALGNQDRGALAWWLGTNIAITAIPAAQLPGRNLEGLVLAKLDFAQHKLTLISTGLSAGHALAGLREKVAVLRPPGAGLVFFELP